jgi:hypothetical protein
VGVGVDVACAVSLRVGAAVVGVSLVAVSVGVAVSEERVGTEVGSETDGEGRDSEPLGSVIPPPEPHALIDSPSTTSAPAPDITRRARDPMPGPLVDPPSWMPSLDLEGVDQAPAVAGRTVRRSVQSHLGTPCGTTRSGRGHAA